MEGTPGVQAPDSHLAAIVKSFQDAIFSVGLQEEKHIVSWNSGLDFPHHATKQMFFLEYVNEMHR